MSFWNIFSKKKRMAEKLEETLLNTKFDLTQEIDTILQNLRELRFERYNKAEIEYLHKRLNEKANLIRTSYSDGKFDYVAEQFNKTARRSYNAHQVFESIGGFEMGLVEVAR